MAFKAIISLSILTSNWLVSQTRTLQQTMAIDDQLLAMSSRSMEVPFPGNLNSKILSAYQPWKLSKWAFVMFRHNARRVGEVNDIPHRPSRSRPLQQARVGVLEI